MIAACYLGILHSVGIRIFYHQSRMGSGRRQGLRPRRTALAQAPPTVADQTHLADGDLERCRCVVVLVRGPGLAAIEQHCRLPGADALISGMCCRRHGAGFAGGHRDHAFDQVRRGIGGTAH